MKTEGCPASDCRQSAANVMYLQMPEEPETKTKCPLKHQVNPTPLQTVVLFHQSSALGCPRSRRECAMKIVPPAASFLFLKSEQCDARPREGGDQTVPYPPRSIRRSQFIPVVFPFSKEEAGPVLPRVQQQELRIPFSSPCK